MLSQLLIVTDTGHVEGNDPRQKVAYEAIVVN